jgi:cyclic pyranopterin phosphate synthase
MLKDRFGRTINYLRVSVTDRCNYRCSYCVPRESFSLKSQREILRYEEIREIVAAGASLGIKKIRLTGGEPLVRKNLEALVASLVSIAGVEEVAMSTNGALLSRHKAEALKKAGLIRVNISLDTLDVDKFSRLTGNGRISDVFTGIDSALEAGLEPVKINMVVHQDTTQIEKQQMLEFCRKKGLRLQTISRFSLMDGANGDPVSTDRPPVCEECNRLRLTSDGYLLPCLFSNKETKVDFDDIEGSFIKAVTVKPENGRVCSTRAMYQIGG